MTIRFDTTDAQCMKFNTPFQARQTRPNSGGVAEGHPIFDKGGVAIIFSFLRVKKRTFSSFYAKRLKKAYF